MSRGGNKLPKRQKAIAGKLHASLGLPPSYFEAALSGKKTKVKKNNIIYSYNIFVMIDQLSNLDDEGKVLDPKAVGADSLSSSLPHGKLGRPTPSSCWWSRTTKTCSPTSRSSERHSERWHDDDVAGIRGGVRRGPRGEGQEILQPAGFR
eukprot:763329-Hanusia_phi.AAC.7